MWTSSSGEKDVYKRQELFHQYRMYDKERLFQYRRASRVNIYSIGNFEDYYYGYMVQNTGYIKYFDLKLYEDGFVLVLPLSLIHISWPMRAIC